jgi:hypothetical protein
MHALQKEKVPHSDGYHEENQKKKKKQYSKHYQSPKFFFFYIGLPGAALMFNQLISSLPVIFRSTGPLGVGLGTGLSVPRLRPSPGRGKAGRPVVGGGTGLGGK